MARQFVVLELSDGQVPKAVWGPFDNKHLADTFALAIHESPDRGAPTTVMELNQEVL